MAVIHGYFIEPVNLKRENDKIAKKDNHKSNASRLKSHYFTIRFRYDKL